MPRTRSLRGIRRRIRSFEYSLSLLVLLLTMMIGVWLNSLLLKSQSGGVSEASGLV